LPIICFHGSPGLPEEFTELAKFFPENQIITFSRKGYPNSNDFQDTPAPKNFIALGYSWGNIPAIQYIMKNKSQAKGLIMVAPYLYSKNNLLKTRLLTLPILSNILFFFFGKRIITGLLKKTSYPLPVPPSYQKLIKKLSEPILIKTAILEKEKNSINNTMLKALGNATIPVGIIWGSDDLTSTKSKQITPLYQFIKPVLEEQLQNAGHAIIFTHPKHLAKFITNFMIKINNKK